MRVLQVIPYFFVDWAGGRVGRPVETVFGLSKALVQRGHEVSVFTTDAFNKTGGRMSTLTNYDGIRVREFSSLGNRLARTYNVVISPAMFAAMSREVKDYDIIHMHEFRTFPNAVACRYAWKHGVPYLIQAHGSLPRASLGSLKRLYDLLFGSRMLEHSARLIAVSEMEAAQYLEMGGIQNRIEVVPNAIDISTFKDLPRRGEFKEKQGLNGQRIILFLGRIAPIKGLDLLVRSFAELSKEMHDISLIIAGPDENCVSALKNLSRELKVDSRVLFPGALYGMDKLAAYVDAEVYVIPSVYEIFGVTILEALACGTPAIVTDKCGIADVIDGQAGIVVPREVDSMKRAITHLLTDERARRQFGERGKALVCAHFTWQRVAEHMETVYQSILERKQADDR